MSLDKFEKNLLKKSKVKEIEYHETGIIDLPKGSIIELRGASNSGILYLGFNMIKAIQDKGGVGLLVDADHTADLDIFNGEKPMVMQPKNGQNAFDVLTEESLLEGVNIIVINSILNLLPLNGDYTAFNKNLSKLYKTVQKMNTSIIILNPYIANRYNMLSIYAKIIIVAKKTKTINKHGKHIGLEGEGIILKNIVNLRCNKFIYNVIYNH